VGFRWQDKYNWFCEWYYNGYIVKTKRLGDNYFHNDFELDLGQHYSELNLSKIYSLYFG